MNLNVFQIELKVGTLMKPNCLVSVIHANTEDITEIITAWYTWLFIGFNPQTRNSVYSENWWCNGRISGWGTQCTLQSHTTNSEVKGIPKLTFLFCFLFVSNHKDVLSYLVSTTLTFNLFVIVILSFFTWKISPGG